MPPFVRHLIFKADDNTITEPVTLLLTFDKGPNPVAWRVLRFDADRSEHEERRRATYRHNLMFCTIRIGDNSTAIPGIFVKISIGQQTTLVNKNGELDFTEPVLGTQDQLVATNSSGANQGMGFGFVDDNTPNPLAVFQVASAGTLDVQFTPTLLVYALTQYQQNQIIQGKITSPLLLVQDLTALPEWQHYLLSQDDSGDFNITAIEDK